MPSRFKQRVLKKTILFKWLVRMYDAYNLWKFFIKTHNRINAIPDNVHHFFVFPFYHTGGAEKVHADIINANKSSSQVVFFTGNSCNDQHKSDFYNNAVCFDLFLLFRKESYKKRILRCIVNKINKSGNNIIFSSNSQDFYSQIVPAVYKKNKCIDLIHAFTHENEPGAEKWSIPVAEKLYKRVVICKAVKNMLIEQYKKNNISESNNSKIEVIYNFVDIAETADLESRSNLPFTVLFIGRNSPEKRLEEIIDAAKILTKNSDINFRFIGPGLEVFSGTNSNKKILYKGNLSAHELYTYYRSSHVIILMSGREGLPVVLQEAMAFGVVPVSTNVGGIPELIENGKTGFLIENKLDSQDRINKAVEHIQALFQDRNLLTALSKNASRFVRESFSKEEFESGFRKLLK